MPRLRRALPGKTVEQIQIQLHRTRSRISFCKTLQGVNVKLRKLVSAVDNATGGGLVDWRKVSAEIGLPPNVCESRYEAFTARSAATATGKSFTYWSAAEIECLKDAVTKQRAMRGHINWRVVAQLIGSKTRTQCCAKLHHMEKLKLATATISEA
ncbi:hypothetical protein GGI24_005551 [Coemansia furcata]|nr:hypothetical protein GGI24_005551 [Coemansia furcata]